MRYQQRPVTAATHAVLTVHNPETVVQKNVCKIMPTPTIYGLLQLKQISFLL